MKISSSEEINEYIDSLLAAMDANIEETESFNGGGDVSDAMELDPRAYEGNPYSKNVRPIRKKIGRVSIEYPEYAKGERFLFDEVEVSEDGLYKEHNPIGYFDREYHFLAIKKDGRTWMSAIPHEINTMDEAIKNAKGIVVALGLGLGYFAYMASLKDEVSEVVVIEKDEEVISIFEEEILPFFENGRKIRIIKGDALKMLPTLKGLDYVFADLWHGAEDGLPLYIALLKLEKKMPGVHFSYWIEESMLCLARRAMIVLLDEARKGYGGEDYEYAETFSDALVNSLFKATIRKEIRNIGDIRKLLDDDGLKDVLSSADL